MVSKVKRMTAVSCPRRATVGDGDRGAAGDGIILRIGGRYALIARRHQCHFRRPDQPPQLLLGRKTPFSPTAAVGEGVDVERAGAKEPQEA